MTDRATQSLEHIKESGEFVPIPDFVIFDEHDEFDENGKLIRRFDRKKLQKIVDRCNARQETSGDLAVIAPGHSLDDPKSEEDQPPPWGYGADWRLGRFGPGQKLGIICTAYVRSVIKTKDGEMVDGPTHVQSFPRRSPEVWPNHAAIPEHARDSIDWIALLRRAPQRDIGLSVYQRNYSADRSPIGSVNRTGKIRYQMETPMPDPNPVDEPRADVSADLPQGDQPPEGHEEFAKHLDYAMSNHPHLKQLGAMCKKYGMGEADPTATNVALPGADAPPPADDDDPAMQRNQRGDVRKSKTQLQLDAQEKRIKAMADEQAIERQRLRVQRYEMALSELQGEYELDVAVELEDCAGLDEKGFAKHLDRIKRNYSRTPVGGDLPIEAFQEPNPAGKDLNNPEVAAKCMKYMRENPEWTAKLGDKAFRESAKILKILD